MKNPIYNFKERSKPLVLTQTQVSEGFVTNERKSWTRKLCLLFSFVALLGAHTVFGAPTTVSLNALPGGVPAASICPSSTKALVYGFTLTSGGAGSAADFQGVTFTTTGSYTATDITKFQLWYNSSSNSLATATKIGSDLTTSLGTGAHSIIVTQALPKSTTVYFFITVDRASAPTTTSSLGVSAFTTSNISTDAGTFSGSAAAGGTQTLVLAVSGLSASASPTPLCSGANLTLSSSATNATAFSWAGPNSFSSASQNPTPFTVSTASAGIYTVTASNMCNTLTATTAIVTVNTTPTSVSASTLSNPVCSGTSLTLLGSATSPISTSYSWAGPNSYTSASLNPSAFTASTLSAGVYTLTATNTCGSTTATTSVVTVNVAPTSVSASASPNPVCTGTSLTLNGSATGATSYAWTGPNSYSSTNLNPSAFTTSSLSAGIYTLAATNTCGTTTATTAAVVVITVPTSVSAVATPNSLCSGSSLTVSGSATGATSYSWVGPNSFSSTSLNPASFTTSTASAGIYTLTATNICGSTSATTTAVTINTTPTSVSATASPGAVCNQSLLTMTGAATNAVSYLWSGPNSFSSTTLNPSAFTASSASAGVYTLTATNGCGSTSAVTSTVTVNALPSISIASFSPSPTIAGLPVSFTVSNTSLSSYTWNFGDATSASTMNPTKTYATTGTFIPTLTVTDANGCSSSDTAVVVVSPVPPITGYNPPLCTADAPDTLKITVPGGTWSSSNTGVASVGSSTGILTAVNIGTATITYHFGAGLYTTISVTAGNSPNPIFGPATTCMGSNTGLNVLPYGSAGAWTSSTTSVATIGTGTGICSAVSLGTTTITWTNPWGCYVTRTQTVVASPAAITGTSFLCAGDTSTYLNDTLGGTWSSTNSGVVSINASTGLATGVASGTATLSYTIAYGCASTKLVNGGSLPATITGGRLLCPGGTSALSCATPGGSWTTSDGTVATVSSGVVTATGTGTANITYTIPSGCRRVATVTVNAAPGANTGTATLCVGGSTTLSNATTSGTWSSGATAVATVGSSTGVVTGISVGNANITYTVSGAGCYSATTVTVNGATGAITGTLNACVGDTSVLSHATTGGTWISSNTSIATVDATSGAVVGVSAGTATITYFITSSCYVTTSFTVKALPTAISGTQSVCVGSTTALASGPTGGSWTSSSATTAPVNASTGVVSGYASGTATISYNISNGCRRTAVVTVNAAPGSITGPTGTCVGSSATLASTTSGGNWSSSNTTVATIDGTTGVVSGLITGTTMISYTLSTGCRATRVMSVVAAPAAISGTAVLCAGSATTLSSTTGGGTWSSSDITVATTGTATGTSTAVSGVSTGNATIYYTVGGCATSTTVTVNAALASISGLNPMCVGNSATFSISSTGGTWVSSSSYVTIGSATGVATAVTAGTATISYRVSTTCYSTLPVTVTATPAAITGTARTCVGYTTVLSHPVSGGSWSGGSSAVSVSDSAGFGVISGSAAGTGTITYTLPSGCYKTVVVTVNSNPATPSGGASPICVGTTTNLTATPAGGTWLSSTTAVGTVGNTTGVVMGVSAGTTTISYRMTATGCFSTKEVSVNPLPGMIVGSSTVCAGATTSLSDTTGGGGIWTMTPATTATIGGSTGTVTGVAAGGATVTYTLSTGCRRTRTMTVLASPSAITGNLTLCVGNTTTLGSSPAGLTWSSGDASIAPVSTTGVVSGYATGMATISYTNASGCSRTAVVTVNAALPANTSSTGAMSVCQGATITLSNTVSGGTWSSASSAIASVGSGTGIVTGGTVGSTNITYAFGTGCRSISTIGVNAAAPAITGTGSVCEGSSVTFTSTGSGTWESGNSSIATVDGGMGIAVPGGPTTVVTGVSAGSTVITYMMPSGCYSTKSILVKTTPVISAPSIMTIGDTLTALSSVSGGTWSSSAAGVAGIVSTSGLVTAMSAGTVTIRFLSSSTGCVGTWVIVVDSTLSKPGITTTTASAFSLYPNPTVGSLTINTDVDGSLMIITIDGRTAGSYELTAGANTIRLSGDLAAGLYLCQFRGTDGSTQQVRIVLQR